MRLYGAYFHSSRLLSLLYLYIKDTILILAVNVLVQDLYRDELHLREKLIKGPLLPDAASQLILSYFNQTEQTTSPKAINK